MGKIWMPGGGGGADLDVITAGAGDVLAGKVIVDKEGEPLTGTLALSGNASDAQVLSGQTYYNSDPKTKRTGTMSNRGAVSQALGINGTYTIPAGYHNGSGKVTQSIATMAGQTITPGTSQQTVSSSGKYMTGNVVVNAVSNLTAANIKKGVVVGGVTGTWEGWVGVDTDLYYNGNNKAGFTLSTKGPEYTYSNGSFETSMIWLKIGGNNPLFLRPSKSYNLSLYSKINFYFMAETTWSSGWLFRLEDLPSFTTTITGTSAGNYYTAAINISGFNATILPKIEITANSSATTSANACRIYLYRIYLS